MRANAATAPEWLEITACTDLSSGFVDVIEHKRQFHPARCFELAAQRGRLPLEDERVFRRGELTITHHASRMASWQLECLFTGTQSVGAAFPN